MNIELVENKWIKNNYDWKLEWTKVRIINEAKMICMLRTIERITCEKYKYDDKYVIINGDNKFEIDFNKGVM